MKSIRCPNANVNAGKLLSLILVFTSLVYCSPDCGLYGAPPCQFLPAPPGQTPTCARPGKTYCEHVPNYPTYLIKHLVHKWGYEAKNILIDESMDEFAAWHETPVFYDPRYIFPYGHSNNNQGNDFNGYKYENPSRTNKAYYNNNNNNQDTPTNYIVPNKSFQPKQNAESPGSARLNFNKYYANNEGLKKNPYFSSTNNSPGLWLKRFVRNVNSSVEPVNMTTVSVSQLTRDVSLNMDLLDIIGVEKPTNSRTKRQSPGRSTLCQTIPQFITPQAALNSRGNWMFVVNEANTARQMVKAELCASNTCSNLCELPIGYNSRCEQKFVQKRLIALQGNGQNLYTDTFWFPSCCVCTISAT